jgi:voltage-gated potassium channel
MMEFTLYFLHLFSLDLLYAGPFLLFLMAMIGLIGYLIGRIEGWSSSDALYHAFINATTVGYGDFRPTKRLSKLLAVALAFVGLLFTGVVVAIALHAADYAYGEVHQGLGFRERSGD